MAGVFCHAVVFKTNVLHFKIENTPIKDTNEKTKFKKMLSFPFVDKRKVFVTKLSFEELNLVFSIKAPKFLKKLQVHSTLYGKEKYVFKRKFLNLSRFHGRFLHFDLGERKPEKIP